MVNKLTSVDIFAKQYIDISDIAWKLLFLYTLLINILNQNSGHIWDLATSKYKLI